MPLPEPSCWPLTSLLLRLGNLALRPVRETDLDTLGDLHPLDLEMNPATARPFGLGERAARSVAMRQEYWQAMGSWTPDNWDLGFLVLLDDEIAGVQSLEGREFALLRTVETASWLRHEHRGRGLGKLARLAVLSLAFDGLGAEVALTEAWSDNAASIGVSRSLGYRPNGSVRHRRDDVAWEMPRLRLDLEGWRAVPRPSVQMDGLPACLPWFGVAGHR